ncbi:MAG: sugar phosphate isomerase/epimerase [Firmicutes bacterium]|jgi:sugar phosphate isomerase/epimerase|nr:sugar phosphate isomerase/epimerase [Bacillota bacterium]MDH7494744.1 sugar phosphate isomerase/epimerase family protein [Bacillota bacterium]
MRYAVSNWIYGDEALETTFQRLSRCGFDGVELVGEPERYRPADVKRLCGECNLQVLSIAGMYPWPTRERDLANPDPEVRENAVAYLRTCVDFACDVGARMIIVVPSAAGKTRPVGWRGDADTWEGAYRDEWAYAVESVRKAARYAEERGVALAIEPINRYESYLVNTAEQGLRFISEVGSDFVRLHLDTFHMNIEEGDPIGAVRSAGGLLVNVHVSDSNRQAVGRGHFDFGALMKALKEIGYGGPLTLEPLPPVPDASVAVKMSRYVSQWEEYVRESLRSLRELECSVQKVEES